MAHILLVLSILLAALAGTGGVAYAADGAVPGAPLYGLDQAIESARLSLTRDPAARIELLLSLAEERLEEAEAVAEDATLQHVALNGYGAAIAAMARGLGNVPETAEQGVLVRLRQSLDDQDARMLRVQAQSLGTPAGDPAPTSCVNADPHPVAVKLAEAYGVSYEQIMTWFCEEGCGFGVIALALETSIATGVPPEELLAMWAAAGGWGEIWQEHGLLGRPEGRPVGPPEDKPGRGPQDAGPQDDAERGQPDDRPVGPPDDKPGRGPDTKDPGDNAGQGQPDDRPVGPPADTPGEGPSDDAQQSPSDDAQQGPSDDTQQSPSDDAQQGPSDDAQQSPSDDAQQSPSDDAQQGPSDGAQQGPSGGGK